MTSPSAQEPESSSEYTELKHQRLKHRNGKYKSSLSNWKKKKRQPSTMKKTWKRNG